MVNLTVLLGHISSFDHPNGFDSSQIEGYKTSLYQYIDNHLKTQMEQLCGSCLATPHNDACGDIVSLFDLLPKDYLTKNIPQIDAPQVEFKIGSADVCNGFVENLEFKFSLGITSLTVSKD